MMSVSIDRGLLRMMQRALETAEPRRLLSAVKSSVRSGAFFFRAELKSNTKRNAFGWPEVSRKPSALIRGNPPAVGAKGIRRPKYTAGGFLGKLANIFRYSMAPDGKSALAGVLRESVGKKGADAFAKFQSGQERAVTPSMRGYFGALGIPLARTTTTITQPPRPIIAPTWASAGGKIGKVMAAKMRQKLGG